MDGLVSGPLDDEAAARLPAQIAQEGLHILVCRPADRPAARSIIAELSWVQSSGLTSSSQVAPVRAPHHTHQGCGLPATHLHQLLAQVLAVEQAFVALKERHLQMK